MPTLGAFIRRRRLELGLTQEGLANRIRDGARQADVSRLENDRVHLPRRERIERIAAALDVPLGHLLIRSGWAGAGDNLGGESLLRRVTTDDQVDVEEVEVLVPEMRDVLAPRVREVLMQMRALVDQAETLIDEMDRIESESKSPSIGKVLS